MCEAGGVFHLSISFTLLLFSMEIPRATHILHIKLIARRPLIHRKHYKVCETFVGASLNTRKNDIFRALGSTTYVHNTCAHVALFYLPALLTHIVHIIKRWLCFNEQLFFSLLYFPFVSISFISVNHWVLFVERSVSLLFQSLSLPMKVINAAYK